MANQNINQITNVATSFQSTDKIYLGRSPFGVNSDYVMTGASVLASFLQPSNNLSDLVDATTARSNLGLQSAATRQATDPSQPSVASVNPNAIIAIGDGVVFHDTAGTLESTQAPVAIPTGNTGGNVAAIFGAPVPIGNLAIFHDIFGTIADGGPPPSIISLPLSGADGGTGVSNPGHSIILGGDIQTANDFFIVGNNTLTLTTTGNTNITFPVSGTLATTAGSLQVANNLSDLNNAALSRSHLGVAIGSNVQAYSVVLDAVSAGTYTGASSITTLGTIATGIWNGTVVDSTYGGTGVNNGANTITLAGNLVTSGANSLTFTTTGPTNVTLPTSGTLLSATSGTFAPTITGSIANPTAITYTNQIGRYTVIGNMVNIYVRVTVNTLTIGLAAGDLQINGLPFASANISNMQQQLNVIAGTLTYTATQLSAEIDPNTQIINISQASTTAPITNASITLIAAGTDIIIQGFYFTS